MIKPFNPILGETFQATMGEYEIALEQISHHPPVSAFQIWNPEDQQAPILEGNLEFEASTGIRSLVGYKHGYIRVRFPDTEQTVEAKEFP